MSAGKHTRAHRAPDRRRRALAVALMTAVVVWACTAFVLKPQDAPTDQAVAAASAAEATTPGTTALAEPDTAPVPAPVPTPVSAPAQLPAATPPQSPLPTCAYGDEPAPRAALHEWPVTLLDTTYRLPADYAPQDLVNLTAALAHVAPGQTLAAAGHQLRTEAAQGLVALFEAAEAQGVKLAVQSAYRSYDYQASTFEYWTQQDGYEQALRTSARPGHSEHQLGTAVDLRSRHGPAAWDLPDWADTPEGAWVLANAHLYGFVLSYPRGEEHRSCYAYEPWHYRYVGRELAQAIHATGDPPRVHLWRLIRGSEGSQVEPEGRS